MKRAFDIGILYKESALYPNGRYARIGTSFTNNKAYGMNKAYTRAYNLWDNFIDTSFKLALRWK